MSLMSSRPLAWLGLLALLTGVAPAHALSEADLLPVDEAFAVSTTVPARDLLEVRFAIADGYYLYRHRLALSAPSSGLTLPPFQVPDGEKKTDEFFGDVETYHQDLTLSQTLPPLPPEQSTLQVELRYQGCADAGICYPPQKKLLTLTLPPAPAGALAPSSFPNPAPAVGGLSLGAPAAAGLPGASQDALPEDQAFRYEAIAIAPGEILVRFTMAPGYYLYRDKTVFSTPSSGIRLGTPAWPVATPHADEHFGEVQVYFGTAEVPLPVARDSTAAQSITLMAEYQGCKDQGICYPVMRRELPVALPAGSGASLPAVASAGAAAVDAGAAPSATPQLSLGAALLLALLGGLILNLMPCVLPILALKALGLAKSAHGPGYARRHAIWYTIGVLVSFGVLGMAILGLRAGGEALGWGFQLQQPAFVGLLVYVMLAVALSMSGVIAFGASWGGLGHTLTEDEGIKGAFFTGVLACVVASPCTAPFMGGALAYAIAQPPAVALAVFLTLGLGLALPFLLIGFIPALGDRLPRPGAWMETLKQALAFPMYLTGVWLLWVLGHQVGMDGAGAILAGCVALAMALWWFERHRQVSRLRRWGLVLVLLAIAAWPLRFVAGLDASAISSRNGPAASIAQVYSSDLLEQLRQQGRPVLVNMTADWCATCKVNERLVLSTDAFQALLKETHTAYLKGDWTNADPAITEFLQRFKAVGVPLYVVYPADGGAPEVLPALLTAGTVEQALKQAAARP
ncbi:MAG: protein-disulfide reductase DsbD [Lysobacterales bacterium]